MCNICKIEISMRCCCFFCFFLRGGRGGCVDSKGKLHKKYIRYLGVIRGVQNLTPVLKIHTPFGAEHSVHP